MTPEEREYIRTHHFCINSACGRRWELSMLMVARDYAKFLVENDGISFKQAMEVISLDDVKSWFSQQYSWEDIDKQAKLVGHPTQEDIIKALDMVRGNRGGVSMRSEIKPSGSQVAKIKRRKLGKIPGNKKASMFAGPKM